ncbi:MAG: AMP-binding protein, partial [Spirochaetota bacterium]
MIYLKNHNKTAIASAAEEISYAQLMSRSCAAALMLAPQLVTEKNDGVGARVAIVSENRAEYFTALFGIWSAGACAVPVDYMSSADEIRYIIEDCRPDVIFASEATISAVREAVSGASASCRICDISLCSDESAPIRRWCAQPLPHIARRPVSAIAGPWPMAVHCG